MSDLSRVKALLFDVFGSVVDWRGSLIRDLTDYGRKIGVAADWALLVDEWRANYQPSMEQVRAGKRPWTKLDDLHRETLDMLIARLKIEGLDEAARRHVNLGWHRLDPWPDAVAGLTRLKRKYVIGTLSNGNLGLLAAMAKRAGLPWDVILSAELVRAYKPQPQSYLGAAELLSMAPDEVMLCAAHNGDLAAARKCGLRTAFWPRPTEYGPRQTPRDLAADSDWDVVAADMVDLAARLGC
ncbi:MAG: haloacid dehalogenase type II [Alphaproteobacteria bacterium]|nr:haloacid dehalogenase type II [Alphaproteobacteria bacterium]